MQRQMLTEEFTIYCKTLLQSKTVWHLPAIQLM